MEKVFSNTESLIQEIRWIKDEIDNLDSHPRGLSVSMKLHLDIAQMSLLRAIEELMKEEEE